jgi:hypothetical protein
MGVSDIPESVVHEAVAGGDRGFQWCADQAVETVANYDCPIASFARSSWSGPCWAIQSILDLG